MRSPARDFPRLLRLQSLGERLRFSLGVVGILSVSFVVIGCGHPASESDCREILRRAAELELRERLGEGSPLIASEVQSIEESMKDTMMTKCVGKRITEDALACVRGAKKSEQLFEECLR